MIWSADIFPISADFNYHSVPHRPLFKDRAGVGRQGGKEGAENEHE